MGGEPDTANDLKGIKKGSLKALVIGCGIIIGKQISIEYRSSVLGSGLSSGNSSTDEWYTHVRQV